MRTVPRRPRPAYNEQGQHVRTEWTRVTSWLSRLYTLNVMSEVAYGVFVPREMEHEKRESIRQYKEYNELFALIFSFNG